MHEKVEWDIFVGMDDGTLCYQINCPDKNLGTSRSSRSPYINKFYRLI